MSHSITKPSHTLPRQMLDLRKYMRSAGHSVLCIGPMSRNSVDAVIGLANRTHRPIPLIASRRQVECHELGGGYVNGWTTQSFAEYVKSRDHGFVHLCRDHGGPWQGNNESSLSRIDAMRIAKISLLEDIIAGFDVVHLDPSVKGGSLNDKGVLEMLFELYAFVNEAARAAGRDIEIEVGAEQQSGCYSDPRDLVAFLKAIASFCDAHHFKKPLFCVVQTGTLVKEMRNVGFTEGRKNESYDQKYAVDTMEKTIKYLVDIAGLNGVFVKEHNGDYLSDGSMSLRRKLEVSAVNVAPELGVCESKTLVTLCQEFGLTTELSRMLDLFYDSGKWEKWLSVDSQAGDFERAIMAGHYSFAHPKFQDIKQSIIHAGSSRGIDVDKHIVTCLEAQLQRMVWNLGYFHNVYPARHTEQAARSGSEVKSLAASVHG